MAASDAFLVRAIAHIRQYAMDTIDEVRWPSASMIELIDTANALVFGEMLVANEPKTHFRLSESTITLQNGVSEYEWPANVRRFLDLIKRDSSGRISDQMKLTSYLSRLPGVIILDEQRGFSVYPPPVLGADESWTLVYDAGVTPFLCYGAAAATGSGTTAIKLNTATAGTLSSDEHFYDNSYVRIVSGTGIGQERRITSYAGSTRIATVARAWTTVPDDTSVFEIMPCLKHPLDKAIMWRVVMMMKASDSDRMGREAARDEFEAIMREVLQKVANRQNRQGPSFSSDYMECFDYGEA